MKYTVSALLLAITSVALIVSAQEQTQPAQSGQMNGMSGMSQDEMNKRGDTVMGFDHTKTTHHFRLLPRGGAIEVTANSATDTESRDQIRMHLGHIARMFAAGNFNAPMLIHGQTPPGVPVMKEVKDQITYKFEKTERGATVLMTTNNSHALEAIHAFLRFQIKEHQTGDSMAVSKAGSF